MLCRFIFYKIVFGREQKYARKGDWMSNRSLANSIEFEKKCSKVIPAGSSTLAKSPNRLSHGYSPFYSERAEGSHFTDIDGNDWLDCEMAMGTVVWGYNRKEINEAIIKQLYKGTICSVPSTLEYELAEILLSRFQQYQAAKFFKNGADAVYAAVRSARHITKRTLTLSCEYHGWLDWCSPIYYDCPPSSLGIPEIMKECYIACKQDIDVVADQIQHNGDQIACIVLCPANYKPGKLKMIIELCHARNIYVIFDEVTSGVRFAYGGATTLYHLEPDFLCLSKGLANGLPLAVVLGGKNEILRMEQLKISNAHSGEHLALVAAIACEDLLSRAKVWPTWEPYTKRILRQLESLLSSSNETQLELCGSTGCFSIQTRGIHFMEDPFRYYLMKYMAQYQIFTKGYIILSDAHKESEIQMIGNTLCSCVYDYIHGRKTNS